MFCSSHTAETNCFIHLLQYYRPDSHHSPWLIPVMRFSCTCDPLMFQEEKYGTVENVHCLQYVDVVNPSDRRLELFSQQLCVFMRVSLHNIGTRDNMQWQQLMVSLLALLLVLHVAKRQDTLTVTASWLKLNLSLVHPVNKRQRGDTMQFIWLTNIDGTHWAPEGVLLSPQLAAPVKTQNLLPDWP